MYSFYDKCHLSSDASFVDEKTTEMLLKYFILPLKQDEVCEGKSNPDWNFSAPHGAGRIMSRSRAAKTLAVDQFAREMEGIYSTSVCRETLDESPMAYKDKEVIIEAIKDTTTILDTVKPILNIKAK